MSRSPTPAPLDRDARERLAGVLRGDDAALDRWYRAEHPLVFRLCLGFLADHTEAEDAAQDAMLHLHDHLDRYDAARDYDTWRTTVVLNLCRDRVRRSASRRRAEAAGEDTAVAAGGRSPSCPPWPGESASRGEVRRILLECLTRLTPREREVFVLRDLSEVPTERVAELLDIGASSVRSLLALARRRIRALLEPRLDALPELFRTEDPRGPA